MVDICAEMKRNVETSLDKLGGIEANKFWVDTEDYGKIIIDIRNGQNGGLIFDAARSHGYGGCLSWSPTQNSFAFSTVVDKPVKHTMGETKDGKNNWGVVAARKNMLIKPRGNSEKVRPISEVIAVLTNCKNQKYYPDKQAQPELFKAILLEDIDDALKNTKESLREQLETKTGEKYDDNAMNEVLAEIKSSVLKKNGF
jgi:hypothetical protein